jgi:polyribonucleotide nucleotidyltransferase
MIHTHTFEVGGKTLSIETGRVAKQAGGSVLLGMGETVVLGTATMSKTAREGIDFLPLVCDFEERKYSIGKIPGGFVKRGGRPSEKSILTSRLIDRPIRPLFPKGMRNDVQVITMAFSVDKECPPDVLSINAAGAALAVSDIPFAGPVAGVRVGYINDELVLFPSNEDLKVSKLDLVVAGHKGAISMVEAGASEVSEELMIKALTFAHKAIQQICGEFETFAAKAGKAKREPIVQKADEALVDEIKTAELAVIKEGIFSPDKATRESATEELEQALVLKYKEKYADNAELLPQVKDAVNSAVKKVIRKSVIEDGMRPDGRKLDEIRPLEAVAGLLPRVHGSGMFTRGQTQVMTILTLGMPKDAQIIDTIDESVSEKRYMHFYNFPPYSVGEVRMLRGPGRREIGHGALAERALEPVVPLDNPDFPYTCLLQSEVLESNGSTSMASVCGSTLALMDAGVPIKAAVAGIAMGLMSDGKTFRVLTDIQGVEDFTGDMDFKVAGTRAGITALQLDTKLDGIPEQVLADALAQAKDARFKILDVIEAEIPAPRSELSPTAPRVYTVQINSEKIGALIGPGGANIRKITEASGCEIDVQQDGRVLVAASDGPSAQLAIDMIKASTMSMEVGMEFSGKITRLMGRGAMVEMPGGRDGMVPTEQLTDKPIRRPDDAVEIGDVIRVRVAEIDDMGRVNLSALGLNPNHERINNPVATEGPSRDDRGGRGGGYGGRGGGGRGRDDRGGRGGGGRDGGRGRYGGGGDRGRERSGGGGSEGSRDGGGGDDVNARFRPRN